MIKKSHNKNLNKKKETPLFLQPKINMYIFFPEVVVFVIIVVVIVFVDVIVVAVVVIVVINIIRPEVSIPHRSESREFTDAF